MNHIKIISKLISQKTALTPDVIQVDSISVPTTLIIPAQHIVPVCQVLYHNKKAYYDHLVCLTAVDKGPEIDRIDLLYHLYSMYYHIALVLKITINRCTDQDYLPKVASVSNIWKTALWHERENFDLFGISFEGHPDLRRILLPEDWEGNPLRKDYKPAKFYQGIKI